MFTRKTVGLMIATILFLIIGTLLTFGTMSKANAAGGTELCPRSHEPCSTWGSRFVTCPRSHDPSTCPKLTRVVKFRRAAR